MDSITQFTLGAACGEATLGRKIGNRALLWGAIGGTLPDLDVLANLFTDEITALAFHRGITHSLLFAVLAPFVLAFLTHRFYQSNWYRSTDGRRFTFGMWILGVFLLTIGPPLGFWLYGMFAAGATLSFPITWFLVALVFFAWGSWYFFRKYFRKKLPDVRASYRDWVLLWFLSIITHPRLDCCTAYGTQIFQPFSDFRVAWNNISVADPLYTIWFLIFLTLVFYARRNSKRRALWNTLAFTLSSAYLTLTVINKWNVNHIFEQSLAEQGIDYERYTVSPAILNNLLWSGAAETADAYYIGAYSNLDPTERVARFTRIEKNHELLAPYAGQRDLEILQWFSNGFYSVVPQEDGTFRFNDLRYGSRSGGADPSADDFIFSFTVRIDEQGNLTAGQGRDTEGFGGDYFQKYRRRVFGDVDAFDD